MARPTTTTTRLPGTACPQCGSVLSAASDVNGTQRPEPGDLSVCLYCGAALIFTDTLRLRAAAGAELAQLPPATRADLMKHQQAVHRLRGR